MEAFGAAAGPATAATRGLRGQWGLTGVIQGGVQQLMSGVRVTATHPMDTAGYLCKYLW